MEIAETGNAAAIAAPRPQFKWESIVGSPAFLPAIALMLGLCAIFWGLFTFTYSKWLGSDGYYSHGFLVPIISGYIVYRWWPRLKQVKVKPGYFAAIPLALTLWVAYAANKTDIYSLLSLALLASLLFAVWLVAGFKWMLLLAAPIMYLAFALPVWDPIINTYTNPLQLASTKVAFQMLRLIGLQTYQQDTTTLILNNYTLDVGVPCSGLKLMLALTAFGTFFMLIARLKVWANIIFAISILPLALFINGLRIALIGVVGNTYGSDAGHAFHDYSGYIAIILCFFILDRWAKFLGWNDQKEADTAEPASNKSQLNGARSRAWAVAGAFVLCGAVVLASPKPLASAGRTEQWMESKAPQAIGPYRVARSYKMDKSTYDELQPYGIVSRIYAAGEKSFDVVLVASNRKTSFHDPRVCFPAQGWSFETQKVVPVQTSRGVLPVTIIAMSGGTEHEGQIAAFFYKGRDGFFPTPQALSWSMFKDQFKGKTDIEGVFYRFMPLQKGASEDELKTFIAQYMDTAAKTSGGFF